MGIIFNFDTQSSFHFSTVSQQPLLAFLQSAYEKIPKMALTLIGRAVLWHSQLQLYLFCKHSCFVFAEKKSFKIEIIVGLGLARCLNTVSAAYYNHGISFHFKTFQEKCILLTPKLDSFITNILHLKSMYGYGYYYNHHIHSNLLYVQQIESVFQSFFEF